jgi:hypothetical protein
MKNLPILFLAVLLISCGKDEKEDVTINYYLTTTSDTTYKRIFFQFDYTRAHRQENSVIRTVYLDPMQVDFDLSNPEEVFLGSSAIEQEKINGYDFGLGQFRVVNGNDTLELVQPFGFDDYTTFPLEPSEGEELNVTFILDVEASIVLDSAGQNWIKPQVKIGH